MKIHKSKLRIKALQQCLDSWKSGEIEKIVFDATVIQYRLIMRNIQLQNMKMMKFLYLEKNHANNQKLVKVLMKI